MQLNMIIDWLFNKVFEEDGLKCPFYYQTPRGWESTFRHYGLKIRRSDDLGIEQPALPCYHWRYVLDVKSQNASVLVSLF
jgi:hypothetical protein